MHQAWGWYDGLGSWAAAGVIGAGIIFLLATSMYLLGATALVSQAREPASQPPATIEPTPTDQPEPTPEPTSTPRPTATAAPRIVVPV
ncbi:MAG: hypothetical protein QOF51_2272, partial [Chloroflexota bacterium]|nr:hypothetical protein [Chloroflexota bacterium]